MVEVEVVFLGTASAFPTRRRSNLCVLLDAPHFRMLIEAGPTVMQQIHRAGFEAADVEMVFVSHDHGDHALGFPMLALNRLSASTPLNVYAGLDTLTTLRILLALTWRGLKTHQFEITWHALSEEVAEQVNLGAGVVMRTVPVPAPPGVSTLAARWTFSGGPSVAFVTDTVACSEAVDLARGADLLIHEASFSATLQPDIDPRPIYHSTARQAGEIARAAGCPRLALVHLSPQVSDSPEALVEEARAGTGLDVIVPEDGDVLRV
ncbi:MAG: MBL fold metallo-hydrolase [Anaerolineae bacterium]|nr:MBL fold metallo-hydrolase [Anaerolineae bacterium]